MTNYIGSTAIKFWYPEFTREPNDIDVLHKDKYSYLDSKETHRQILVGEKMKRIENHYIPPLSKYVIEYNGSLPPDILLTLKASHLFWDIFWDKHMYDVQFLFKKGNRINHKLFYELYDYWNSYHTKNTRSKLDMTSDDFFNNAVRCEYDHDWLHTLINPYPTFNKVLKDGAEVDVDEKKFNLLNYEEKFNLVSEELMVMAYERWPSLDYRKAYNRMLKKFIMNHAPLWEALFIINDYINLIKPKFNYINLINEKIHDGRNIIFKKVQ